MWSTAARNRSASSPAKARRRKRRPDRMSALAATIAVATGVLVAMVVLSVWAAQQLPDGPVPVQFDIRGKAEELGSRWILLGLLPALYVPTAALMIWVAQGSPEKAGDLVPGAALASLITLAV